MGRDREQTNTSGSQNQNTTVSASPEETAFNKLQLAQAQEFDPIQRELNKRGGNLINMLLAGESNLPGFLSRLPGGISPDVTKGIVDESLTDLNTQLAKSGAGTFMESGPAQSIGTRTAGDIRRASEEFNLGNLFNLLNLAVGGQAQVQQPILATGQLLSSRLAGLRSTNTSGTFNQNTVRQLPFSQTFANLGQGFSNFGSGFKSFGGR